MRRIGPVSLFCFCSGAPARHPEPTRASKLRAPSLRRASTRMPIDIYSQLFAEYVHPMYIYNIGRCYQNMGAPDNALASFREYLRKERHVTPALKQEIAGHIKEMEELRKQQHALRKAGRCRGARSSDVRGGTGRAARASQGGGRKNQDALRETGDAQFTGESS